MACMCQAPPVFPSPPPMPLGGLAASTLHLARTVCRRAERSVVPLTREGFTEEAVAVYLNRLSDYFFSAARLAVRGRQGGRDVGAWDRSCSSGGRVRFSVCGSTGVLLWQGIFVQLELGVWVCGIDNKCVLTHARIVCWYA
jgi:hypothetical protein